MKVNDWGTPIIVTIKVGNAPFDVSEATGLSIKFEKPQENGELTKDAELLNDGTDGKIQYVVEEGALDVAGTWKLQGVITFGDGKWHTDVGTFEVGESL